VYRVSAAIIARASDLQKPKTRLLASAKLPRLPPATKMQASQRSEVGILQISDL